MSNLWQRGATSAAISISTTMATQKKTSKADALMERYEVSVIYENSRGEFFLEHTLALNSEAGNKDKVKTHKK